MSTVSHAQTTIGSPGGSSIGFFGGPPFTRTIGQTFTTPTDNRLDRFSFFVGGQPTTMNFRAYVIGFEIDFRGFWVATSSTPLFASGPLSVTTSVGSLSRIDVSTGGLALVSGQRYGAFISTLDVLNSSPTGLIVSKSFGNQYDGGEAVRFNGTTAQWNSEFWPNFQGDDLEFEMVFGAAAPQNVVPEPSTYALMATGLIGLVMLRRRRSRPAA
ncbi:MAG: PEP-CTERM sorting domain-containing protein [Gemmatimonadaceae bacterium]|nr:PEP-CTERM sorting domain-containing protein [Gemmatimonadaceae bacterium]